MKGAWVVNTTSKSLYSIARHAVSITEQADWAPGQVWTCVDKRKFLVFTGVQIPEISTLLRVFIPTTLSQPYN
jgi:hypothetical protein